VGETPHWKTTLDTKGGPPIKVARAAHGPGADHVAGGGDVSKIFRFKDASTKEVDARCLTCHAGAHPNFDRSPHARAKVGCTSCHKRSSQRGRKTAEGCAACALLPVPRRH